MAKILIAEDEPDIQTLIELTLHHVGHEVVVAEDGQAAYELAKREQPDLILLDVRMPKLNGYEACQLIKAEPALRYIPVVFLSVRGSDSEIRLAYEAGAAEYLVKPFAPSDLNRKVTELLRQK